jgi:hypothetical protein
MKTFYELMQDAQQNALQAMTKEFGITPSQQASAFEAMMPAFWLGLRRNASDPFGVAAFWQQLATQNFRPYFENPFAALAPSAQKEGEAVLARLFGSPELARAVALQVEAATGVAQDVVKRMMPVMANMMMGGLQQAATDANPFLRFFEAAKGTKKTDEARPDLPFVAMMETFLGKEKKPEQDFGPMTSEEVIDRMFDAGRSMQDTYRKSMESLFEQFAPPGGKR